VSGAKTDRTGLAAMMTVLRPATPSIEAAFVSSNTGASTARTRNRRQLFFSELEFLFRIFFAEIERA
jgi:hypothetical protein